MTVNYGKESVELDLKTDEGKGDSVRPRR